MYSLKVFWGPFPPPKVQEVKLFLWGGAGPPGPPRTAYEAEISHDRCGSVKNKSSRFALKLELFQRLSNKTFYVPEF